MLYAEDFYMWLYAYGDIYKQTTRTISQYAYLPFIRRI